MRSDDWLQGADEITRRRLLQRMGAGGLALAGAGLLSACGGSSTGPTQSTTVATGDRNFGAPATPARGGTLRMGMIGNGTAETANPNIVTSPIDTVRVAAIFDPMIRPAPFYKREPGLVVDWAHNDDATVWELKLRSGVTWHDGKPLTADDLIYTLRTFGAPTSFGGNAVSFVALRDLKKLDDLTVRVPLKIPVADLGAYFIYVNSTFVIQDGTKDFRNPVGTGPYKVDSFVPGQRMVASANRDYWDSPKPYPDKFELVSIDDPTARMNALTSGQIDIAAGMPYAEARANLNNDAYRVVVGQPGLSYVFYMRVDAPAFRDPRVREAMKLIPDRQAMINSSLSGFGDVGRDLIAPGVAFFNDSLPARKQDLEKAKSLLKAAGASDLRVTLHTAEILPGFVDAASVFAEQAKAAGVQIEVKREQIAQYFNPSVLYLKMPFAQSAWPGPSLNASYSLQYLKQSFFNETRWSDPAWDKQFAQAQAETDQARAQELWNGVQKTQYDRGGDIVWAYWKSTDAVSNKVRGFGERGSGWLYGTDDDRVWNWGLA